MISCKNQSAESTKSNTSPYVIGGEYEQRLSKELKEYQKEQELEEKERLANVTDIKFHETEVDLGKVKVGSVNQHYFVIENTGDRPLIIESLKASCGCTTPIKPKSPIQPGNKDSILIKFVPFEGMQGQQEKIVNVKTNTYIPLTKLFLHANIE